MAHRERNDAFSDESIYSNADRSTPKHQNQIKEVWIAHENKPFPNGTFDLICWTSDNDSGPCRENPGPPTTRNSWPPSVRTLTTCTYHAHLPQWDEKHLPSFSPLLESFSRLLTRFKELFVFSPQLLKQVVKNGYSSPQINSIYLLYEKDDW